MTNFERIKTMNVAEMAKFLEEISDDHCDYPCEHCEKKDRACRGCCGLAIVTWLKAPVSEWMPKL